MDTFEAGIPEYMLMLLTNYGMECFGNSTTGAVGNIGFLHTLPHRDILCDIDILVESCRLIINIHFYAIHEG